MDQTLSVNCACSGSGGSDLDKEPRGDEGQAAVLTIEAVMIGVEGKVVEIEEPETQTDRLKHKLTPHPNLSLTPYTHIYIHICYDVFMLCISDSPQPVTFTGVGVAADGVVLIGQPDDEDDVEGRRRVIEELRHDGLHA